MLLNGASSGQQESTSKGQSPGNGPTERFDEEPEVKTADSLESNLKDLINSNAVSNTYVELPQLNLDTVIAKNEDIHELLDTSFARSQAKNDDCKEKMDILLEMCLKM